MSAVARISLEHEGAAVTARVSGEVDVTNASFVREELTSAVSNEARVLVIDLSETRYLDSAAIEVLFELSRRLARRRQELSLVVPPSSPLRRVLTVCEVATVAPMHDNVAGALGGYPGPG